VGRLPPLPIRTSGGRIAWKSYLNIDSAPIRAIDPGPGQFPLSDKYLTEELKYFKMDRKRRILIVCFLHYMIYPGKIHWKTRKGRNLEKDYGRKF
jgi:hypothetical protein